MRDATVARVVVHAGEATLVRVAFGEEHAHSRELDSRVEAQVVAHGNEVLYETAVDETAATWTSQFMSR